MSPTNSQIQQKWGGGGGGGGGEGGEEGDLVEVGRVHIQGEGVSYLGGGGGSPSPQHRI